MQKQIRLLNEKLGVEDPSDMSKDTELYKYINQNLEIQEARKIYRTMNDIE
jgi:hypothetical protein